MLLGTKSFGESSIESVIPLQGNGAIRLTTARFMTPSGQQIQGKGLTPDLTVMPLKLAKLPQGDRRREADLRGALKNTDPGARGRARTSEAKAIPGAAAERRPRSRLPISARRTTSNSARPSTCCAAWRWSAAGQGDA